MKPKIDIKPKTSPILASLPEYLKHPKNYENIQRQIIASVQTDCSHSELLEYAKCKKCTQKMLERRYLLKRLGFKNPTQYYAWKRVHENIRERFPLVDWSKLNAERLIEKLKHLNTKE